MSETSKTSQQHLEAITEARELFMEAEFDQAMAKFKEAGAAVAGCAKSWPEALAAETGQAEVRIQLKDWSGAAEQLAKAVAAADKAAGDKADSGAVGGARDRTRASYMLGIALLGQHKPDEAKRQFEAALKMAESPSAGAECRAMLPDVQDRLAQMDEEIEEEDLMEIAMEFGVAGERDEDEDDEEDEEYVEGEEDDEEEEDEEAVGGVANSRKRRAVQQATRANGGGGGDDDDEEDDDDEDFEGEDEEEEEEEEDEAEAAVPTKRARVKPQGPARNGRRRCGAGDEEEEEEDEEEEEEVSSSA